jgi:hypothetical protein
LVMRESATGRDSPRGRYDQGYIHAQSRVLTSILDSLLEAHPDKDHGARCCYCQCIRVDFEQASSSSARCSGCRASNPRNWGEVMFEVKISFSDN